jgi:transketolase N-terminal domain/subunit
MHTAYTRKCVALVNPAYALLAAAGCVPVQSLRAYLRSNQVLCSHADRTHVRAAGLCDWC